MIRVRIKPGAALDLADAHEAIAAIASLGDGVANPVLVDMRDIAGMSRECRAYFAGPETARHESAVALLVGSPLTQAIGNFFLGLNQPLFPTRLFTSEEHAVAWLTGFVR